MLASVCQFDDDEEAAFAYAESLVTPRPSRPAISNRASQTMNDAANAMRARDVHAVVGFYADKFTYDDRRRLSGDPINDRAELRAAAERILAQYTRFEARTLAVRGERLQLAWTRSSDDAGNETSQLHVTEVDDEGRIAYEGRFDGDNFEGAYRELERRYYADEGAAHAESGAMLGEVMTAINRGDLDRVFGELIAPGFRFESRSQLGLPGSHRCRASRQPRGARRNGRLGAHVVLDHPLAVAPLVSSCVKTARRSGWTTRISNGPGST